MYERSTRKRINLRGLVLKILALIVPPTHIQANSELEEPEGYEVGFDSNTRLVEAEMSRIEKVRKSDYPVCGFPLEFNLGKNSLIHDRKIHRWPTNGRHLDELPCRSQVLWG